MLQVKSVRDYVSKNGNDTFVYEVSGDKAAMTAFKKAQGEYYREDDKSGTPLWFTTSQGQRSSNGMVTLQMTCRGGGWKHLPRVLLSIWLVSDHPTTKL